MDRYNYKFEIPTVRNHVKRIKNTFICVLKITLVPFEWNFDEKNVETSIRYYAMFYHFTIISFFSIGICAIIVRIISIAVG